MIILIEAIMYTVTSFLKLLKKRCYTNCFLQFQSLTLFKGNVLTVSIILQFPYANTGCTSCVPRENW